MTSRSIPTYVPAPLQLRRLAEDRRVSRWWGVAAAVGLGIAAGLAAWGWT